MNLDSRSGLEEERRLFYVALTRAEKRAFLSYTQSRYRWGKLNDAEPSRFIEEIDESFLDYEIPQSNYEYKPLVNTSIFGDHKPTKVASQVPKSWDGKPNTAPNPTQLKKLRKLQEAPLPTSLKKNSLNYPLEQRLNTSVLGKGLLFKSKGLETTKKPPSNSRGWGRKSSCCALLNWKYCRENTIVHPLLKFSKWARPQGNRSSLATRGGYDLPYRHGLCYGLFKQ